MTAGQKQGTGARGVGVDRSGVGRDYAGRRVVRGPAQERRGAVQSHQQDRSGIGEKDTDQGHKLSVDGEHPEVSTWYYIKVV